MLTTKVKVGQVTNLSEARYCAGMGVDFLSFPISSIDPKMYREITGWVAGPKFGVEVEDSSLSSISEYKSDFLVLSARRVEEVRHEKLIVTLETADWQTNKSRLRLAKENIQYLELKTFLIDDSLMETIREISEDFKVLLKPDLTIDLNLILKLPVDGLSFDGNVEIKPGLKEYPLSEILEKLEED